MRRQIKKGYLFIIMSCLLGWQTVLSSQPSEYLIKAVFLEKFTRFIDWPPIVSLNDTTSPFIIGIYGENPFDFDLTQLYMSQKIKNKPVKIKTITNLNDITHCHILFISKSETQNAAAILKKLENKPVLTVGDSDRFSGQGIIINMLVSGNKLRFEIDETAIHKSGLQVSYLLLQEAEIVNPYKTIE